MSTARIEHLKNKIAEEIAKDKPDWEIVEQYIYELKWL